MVVPWVSKAYFTTGLVVSQLNLVHIVVPGISIWLGGASALVQGLVIIDEAHVVALQEVKLKKNQNQISLTSCLPAYCH